MASLNTDVREKLYEEYEDSFFRPLLRIIPLSEIVQVRSIWITLISLL